jgi:uncharacterized protein YwgA
MDAVLAAMAASDGSPYSPVQIQKFMFLLDRNLPRLIAGKKFHFMPREYGPFDPDVYNDLENLAHGGMVEIDDKPNLRRRAYRLTPEGQAKGKEKLDLLDNPAKQYVAAVSAFVRQASFQELVSSIYKKYPEMQVNSIFRE